MFSDDFPFSITEDDESQFYRLFQVFESEDAVTRRDWATLRRRDEMLHSYGVLGKFVANAGYAYELQLLNALNGEKNMNGEAEAAVYKSPLFAKSGVTIGRLFF